MRMKNLVKPKNVKSTQHSNILYMQEEQIQASNKLKFAAQIFTYFTTLLKI